MKLDLKDPLPHKVEDALGYRGITNGGFELASDLDAKSRVPDHQSTEHWLSLDDNAISIAVRDVETLIVSDVHLGIKASRPGSLLETLKSWRFERLILLGDILHDHNVRRFCEKSWELLAFISHLSRDRRKEVIWVYGNHDRHLAPLIAKLTGIQARDSFNWNCNNKNFIAIHGDAFDHFLMRNEQLARWMTSLYTACQNLLSSEGSWPSKIAKLHVGFSGLSDTIAEKAVEFADREGADVIVCGHTHVPMHKTYPSAFRGSEQFVRYYNTGSWVNRPASFLSISGTSVDQHVCP